MNDLEENLSKGMIISPEITSSLPYSSVNDIAKELFNRTKCRPKLGIICGSGLGVLAESVEDSEVIEYSDITGFPVSTVPGHAGRLVFGRLGGKSIVLMQGRVHIYEGYPLHKITLPVRVMKLMGVSTLIVTNAAGGLNENYKVGDIMIIKDHINLPGFSGINPLVGPNDERFGPRFPAMSTAYDVGLRKIAKKVANQLGFSDFVREGVYCMLGGPSFETVTESRLLRMLGADATGMSTVPEVIIANHSGMKIMGISLITNCCIMEYDSPKTANHKEVLETGQMRSKDLQKMVVTIIKEVDL